MHEALTAEDVTVRVWRSVGGTKKWRVGLRATSADTYTVVLCFYTEKGQLKVG